jgi:hypothetical protein
MRLIIATKKRMTCALCPKSLLLPQQKHEEIIAFLGDWRKTPYLCIRFFFIIVLS